MIVFAVSGLTELGLSVHDLDSLKCIASSPEACASLRKLKLEAFLPADFEALSWLGSGLARMTSLTELSVQLAVRQPQLPAHWTPQLGLPIVHWDLPALRTLHFGSCARRFALLPAVRAPLLESFLVDHTHAFNAERVVATALQSPLLNNLTMIVDENQLQQSKAALQQLQKAMANGALPRLEPARLIWRPFGFQQR